MIYRGNAAAFGAPGYEAPHPINFAQGDASLAALGIVGA